MKKILTADFSKGNEKAYVRGLYQHDYGAILKVTGIEYAEIIRVDFAGPNDEKAHPVVALQESDGGFCVKIPKENTDKAGELSAYIYVTDAEAGFTIKEVILPIIGRVEADPDPSGEKTDPFAEAIEEIKKNAKSASDSAASAAESEKSASKSATQAEKSAVQSWKAVEAAAISEKAAATSATAAAESASQSRESAAIASSAADQAAKSATAAAESATTAAQLAENATRSATNASGSAESASQSAETAKTAADAASKSGSAAQQAAGSASESASTATAAAQTATTAAGKAAGSATSASQSAENAGQKATAAETAAGSAAESETEAAKSATAAGDSASAAKTSETAAEEAAQTAQEQAEKIKASAEQIEKNKTDVTSLKEDLSNKITKFYASNQAETHLADSDNGKIMDMMLYGKSEQFTTSGKNLLKIRDGVQTLRGITVTAKDGVVALKGTATETGWAIFDVDSFVLDGTCVLISYNIHTNVRVVVANKSFRPVLEQNESKAFENVEVSKVCFTVTEGETYDISNILIQIEKGSVATSYEPYTGGQPSPSPDYPQEIKSVVNPTVKVSNEDGTKSQTVTLPCTLNAIPVESGGNVTIDGQQYIADYVDVERGKLVRMVGVTDQDTFETSKWANGSIIIYSQLSNVGTDSAIVTISSKFTADWSAGDEIHHFTQPVGQTLVIILPKTITTIEQGEEIRAKGFKFYYILVAPIEINLTEEEITALKELTTYYPTTNISVSSEQLDGYTVFNYPISMANGWNYVKQQLNDNRDYIYDMDIQSAEAYVNSEYAVALTELEV